MSNNKDNSGQSSQTKKNFRLLDCVSPIRQEITLNVDVDEKKFDGHTLILIEITKATDVILINNIALELSGVILRKQGGGIVAFPKYETDAEVQLTTLKFGKEIQPGKYELFLPFAGKFTPGLRGMYPATWKDPQGVVHNYAATQFEATDARRVIPCFDEPAKKCIFKATVNVASKYKVFSNGPVLSEKDGGNRTHTFEFEETTQRMSSYLLAFICGEFESTEPRFVNGTEVRIWTPPGMTHLAQFALECAVMSLDFLEDYFKSKYPWGKVLNHIALPEFPSGAMENVACVVHRMTQLLVDPKTATQAALERVAHLCFHETAHMWFGNKVTMEWWDALFLNEGFARFMELKGVDKYFPAWKTYDTFASAASSAFKLDALQNTHAIECPAETPEEARSLFDTISYDKTGWSLRMFEQYMTEEVCQAGTVAYMEKHAWGNTKTSDLREAWSNAYREAFPDDKIDLGATMEAWLKTPGHPIVEVRASKKPGFIILTQRPFRFLPKEGDETLWPIPMIIRAENIVGESREIKILFATREMEVEVGLDTVLVIGNSRGCGFYRVQYTDLLLRRLGEFSQERLSVIERFQLINDAWSGVRAGDLHPVKYLMLIGGFQNEDDPNVWSIILGSLRAINRYLPEAKRPAIVRLVQKLAQPLLAKLGWAPAEGESVQTGALRASVVSVLGTIGQDEEVIGKVRELFESWKKDENSVDPEVVSALFDILAYNGGQAEYDQLSALYADTLVAADERRFTFTITPQLARAILWAKAAFRKPEQIEQALSMLARGEVVLQDAPRFLEAVVYNQYAHSAAWQHMKQNWKTITEQYPPNLMPDAVGGVIEGAVDEQLEADILSFLEANPYPAADRRVTQSKEQLIINRRTRERVITELAPRLIADDSQS